MPNRMLAHLRRGLSAVYALAALWVTVAAIGYGVALQRLDEWKRTGREAIELAGGRVQSMRRLENEVLEIRLENDRYTYYLPIEWIELPPQRPLRKVTGSVSVGTYVSIRPSARRLVYEFWVNPSTPFGTRWVDIGRAQRMYDAFIDGQVLMGRRVFWAAFALPPLAWALWLFGRRFGARLTRAAARTLMDALAALGSRIQRAFRAAW